MKKFLLYFLTLIFLGGEMSGSLTFAQNNEGFGSTEYVQNIKGIPGTDDPKIGASLLDTVKKFINWMLGLLATIALVICLYAGFLMVTAAGDDGKHKKGVTILKQAAIGLVIIGLSRSFVSFIFWIIDNFT